MNLKSFIYGMVWAFSFGAALYTESEVNCAYCSMSSFIEFAICTTWLGLSALFAIYYFATSLE